jgi:class 3 adenylate cyclase
MAEPHTLTFLFTDVEGSTSLWEKNPKAMSEALVRHDEILRTAIEAHDGHVFKTVGDAFRGLLRTFFEQGGEAPLGRARESGLAVPDHRGAGA